jgi:hypothetical protein
MTWLFQLERRYQPSSQRKTKKKSKIIKRGGFDCHCRSLLENLLHFAQSVENSNNLMIVYPQKKL